MKHVWQRTHVSSAWHVRHTQTMSLRLKGCWHTFLGRDDPNFWNCCLGDGDCVSVCVFDLVGWNIMLVNCKTVC